VEAGCISNGQSGGVVDASFNLYCQYNCVALRCVLSPGQGLQIRAKHYGQAGAYANNDCSHKQYKFVKRVAGRVLGIRSGYTSWVSDTMLPMQPTCAHAPRSHHVTLVVVSVHCRRGTNSLGGAACCDVWDCKVGLACVRFCRSYSRKSCLPRRVASLFSRNRAAKAAAEALPSANFEVPAARAWAAMHGGMGACLAVRIAERRDG
jgi:hypothetical protein